MTLPAQYAEQGLRNDRASVRPSVPSFDSSSGGQQVFAAERRASGRYRWTAAGALSSNDAAARRSVANAGSVMLRAEDEAEHKLVFLRD